MKGAPYGHYETRSTQDSSGSWRWRSCRADSATAPKKPQPTEAPIAPPGLPSQEANVPQVPYLQSRNLLMPLEKHKCRLVALAFSSDGNTLASVGDDGILRIWDVNQEAVIKRYYPSYAEVARSQSVDDAFLVSKKMLLLEQSVLPPAKKYQRFPITAFSPDLKAMAYGPVDGCVKLRDLSTGKICGSLAIPNQHSVIGRMIFSRDGKTLAATAGHDGVNGGSIQQIWAANSWQAIAWDIATARQLCTIEHIMPGTPMVFLPHGHTLALTDNWSADRSKDSPPVTTCLFDVCTGQKKQTLLSSDYKDMSVTAWAISGDGKTLAVAELRCTEKPVEVAYWQIVIRKLATGEELARFRPKTISTRFLALSEDGSLLVSRHECFMGCHHEYQVC